MLVTLLRQDLEPVLARSHDEYFSMVQDSIQKLNAMVFDLTRMILVEKDRQV